MPWNPYPEGDPLHDAYGKGVNPYTGQAFTPPEPAPWQPPEDTWRDQASLWDRVAALTSEPATMARLAYQAGLTSRPVAIVEAMARHLAGNQEARELVRLMYQAGLEDGVPVAAAELVQTSMADHLAELERIARRKLSDAGHIGTTGPRDPAQDWPGA